MQNVHNHEKVNLNCKLQSDTILLNWCKNKYEKPWNPLDNEAGKKWSLCLNQKWLLELSGMLQMYCNDYYFKSLQLHFSTAS